MVKKDQTDYAAAYRQYCTYERGRTLKNVSSQKMAIDCNLYLRCEQKF